MKTFLSLNFNLFLVAVVPIIMLFQIIVYPVSEEVWCGQKECRTMEQHIIYVREEFRGPEQLRNKQDLELYEIRDKYLPINQYFLSTPRSDNHLIFSSGYLIKSNAERDLKIIKNNENIRLTKKNVPLITFLCSLYLTRP